MRGDRGAAGDGSALGFVCSPLSLASRPRRQSLDALARLATVIRTLPSYRSHVTTRVFTERPHQRCWSPVNRKFKGRYSV